MGLYLAMTPRLLVTVSLMCLAASGCASTTAGTATTASSQTGSTRPTTAETLPTLLLAAADVGPALGSDVVVTREVTTPWTNSGHLQAGNQDPGCLAVAGAAQRSVYDGTGWTALRGQVLREPPAATWSHYAVQAVVLFPTVSAATEFFDRSRDGWSGCANRELTYAQAPAPDQVWSVGPVRAERDMLSVSREQRSPQRWSCQRALTVRGTVAVDVEACSLEGPTSAAATIAAAVGDRLPAA